MKVDMDYGLRFYVKELYPVGANKRGGQSFTPIKKDKTAFKIRVQYAINRALNVIDLTSEKYPVNFN